MSHARARRAAAASLLAVLGTAGAAHAAVPFDESIHLSWDGHSYTGVTTESFLGAPVAVPGDSASRTLLVRNDGPMAGTLRASIVNVELLDPDAPDVHHEPAHRDPDGSGAPTGDPYLGAGDQGSFYDDLLLHWSTGSASLAELDTSGTTQVLEIELAKGEEIPLTLAYELPLEATSGNGANVAPRQASFDVLLEIGGDWPTEPGPDPSPTLEVSDRPSVAPDPPAAADPPAGSGGREELGRTGAEVRLLGALAALGIGLGAAALVARRNRATDGPPGS